MNIEHIKIFVMIAEGDTFHEVAKKLHTTQSSISKIIQKLETELRNNLFDRTGRFVQLTPFGKFFLENSKCIAEQYDILMKSTEKYTRGDHLVGYILGVEDIFSIADISLRFRERTPNIYYSLDRCFIKDQVLGDLSAGKIDFAIMHRPYHIPEDIELFSLARDELYVMLPVNHPLAGQASIYVDQLRQEKIIVSDYIYSYMGDIFEEYSIHSQIQSVFPGSSKTSIARRIESSYGISCYFESDLKLLRESSTTTVKKLMGVREMPLSFARKKGMSSSATTEYKDYLKQEISQIRTWNDAVR